MMDLNLLEIEKACKGTLVLNATDGENTVSSVVLDSRQVTSGVVFLATVGERVDGHRFIGDVYAKGVALVITEKTPKQVESEHGINASDWKSYIVVKDSFQALKQGNGLVGVRSVYQNYIGKSSENPSEYYFRRAVIYYLSRRISATMG